MARLPTRDDLGGLPSARSGRVIANYDTSAIGRGVAAGGEARGRGLANLGAAIAGAATDIGRIGATAGSSRGIGGVGQAEQFEAQRRFLEFNAAQEQAYEESKGTVDPGAFGFREKAQQNYLNSAKEFFKTIPDALKPEYDMKLFQAEDNILSKSRAFETTERVRYYGEEVNKGLGTLENNLFSNPGNFDKNYSEGVSFINAIPDESLSRIQKADLVKQWRTKAQLASLNGVSPQERIRLLGGAPNPVQTQPTAERGQAVTRGMPGEIRQVVSDAAARYGVDPNALLTIAWIESRGNPNAKNPNSSAGGLFQFIDSTARGYGLSNKFDPAQAADAAARLARDNSQALEGVLGRKPTAGELYLAHQQGIGGATKLLSNPNAKAVDLVGADAVRLNGGSSDMTAGDFAMLWMKKAGDTHVPDGGFMGAQYDASRADPRFSDMNYADAQKIIQGSQSEINNSITLAERARAEESTRAAAALKASQAQANDEYRLRIATDDQTLTEQMILDDARIDAGTKATLITSYQTAQKENAGVNEFIQSIAAGGASVNPFNSEQTNIADKAFDKMLGAVSDPDQAASLVSEFASASGYVPKKVQSELRRGVASTDPADVARSMQTADVLRSGAPTSFNNFEGGDAVRKGLDLFTAYTEKMGFSPEEAAQKIIDLNDPEKMRVRDAIIKSEPVKKVLKDVSSDDVAAIFDKGVFSAAPDVGGAAGVEGVKIGVNSVSEAAIVSDYRSILEESIADANGDMDAAKELAKTRFSRTYGTTEFSPLGSGIVMRYPPEKAYPVGPDGTHEYIREQAIEALKQEGIGGTGTQPTTELRPGSGSPVRPFNPDEFISNSDGSISTERTVTIQDQNGKWVNVPSLWKSEDGYVDLSQDEDAIAAAAGAHEKKSGVAFQRFGSLEDAENAAKARSDKGGAGSQEPIATIYLQGDNGTEQDIRAGRPARYQVFYEQDGKIERFFLPFFADPSAAKAAEQGKKDQSLKDAESRMIENRARFQSESEADQRILDETVGPDWMKAQQMMGQQERRRQDETIQQFQGDRPSITGGGGGGGY